MLKYLFLLVLQFPLWFATAQPVSEQKGEVFYEIFIRSFYDSNQDGIGDIKGITQKLDYLKTLGITGIWITPIHPSPTYHKYDVIDYMDIDPEYGTMEDYKQLIAEAHKREIKILLDLVVNHTSSIHPWFIEACHNNPTYRNYYVWDTITQKNGWHSNPLNPSDRYYGFFWEGMPDLNFDNKKVREEIKKVGRFWLKDIGVDGFRLDAAQHIYEATDLDKNNAWWTEFRKDMQQVKPDMILLGEVWNKNAMVATYLKSSMDACFNFDLSGAIVQSILKQNADSVLDKLIGIDRLYRSYNPKYMDATFISNHDQDRYRSTFEGDTAKTKLAFAILMTLPGTPFIYYGEEIGMIGKFPDHYRREPFIWSNKGNTNWEKAVHSKAGKIEPLEKQINDKNSFYTYYAQMIAYRKSNPIFTFGELNKSAIASKLPKELLVYELKLEKKKIIVIHNTTGSVVKLPKSPKFKLTLLNGAYLQNVHVVVPANASVVME